MGIISKNNEELQYNIFHKSEPEENNINIKQFIIDEINESLAKCDKADDEIRFINEGSIYE